MANKKRNTWPCFEVGYVSSSFLIGSDPWYPSPPRKTIHGNSLSC
jgi:hypothetical protein